MAGYNGQLRPFHDPESGGLFWAIKAGGEPLDTRKQIYGQVFGIYALAEYYRATGEKPALDQAIAIYRLVEEHAHDGVHGGYLDALNFSGDGRRRSASNPNNPLGDPPKSQKSRPSKSCPLTWSLLRVWPDAGLLANQKELIDLTLTRIIDPRTHHLVLFMKDDWTPISARTSHGQRHRAQFH